MKALVLLTGLFLSTQAFAQSNGVILQAGQTANVGGYNVACMGNSAPTLVSIQCTCYEGTSAFGITAGAVLIDVPSNATPAMKQNLATSACKQEIRASNIFGRCN